MFIEFQLPQGAAGQSAAHALMIIKKELEAWSQRYDVPYRQKTEKYRHRVTFDNDETYSFFAMSWNPDKKYHSSKRWSLIEDRNNRP